MSSIQVKSNLIKSAFNLLGDFVTLFFPNHCLGCSSSLYKGEEILCTRCILELPKTKYHEDTDNTIKVRLSGRLSLTYALAYLKFRKTGVVQHLLHQLKYNNHPEIGVRLGKIYGKDLVDSYYGKKFDLIIPIPLHNSRKRRRGYNQSAKFAEGLSHSMQIPWDDSIAERKIRTATQTRKTKSERWENVKDVFQIAHPEKIINKRILLVDDVITTGATLEACGQQLLNYGCSELSIACIAEAQ
jgi:ComF family protein